MTSLSEIVALTRAWPNMSETEKDEITARCDKGDFDIDEHTYPLAAPLPEALKKLIDDRRQANQMPRQRPNREDDIRPCRVGVTVGREVQQLLQTVADEQGTTIAKIAREFILSGMAHKLALHKPAGKVKGVKGEYIIATFTVSEAQRIEDTAKGCGWFTATYCRAVIEAELKFREAEKQKQSEANKQAETRKLTLGFTADEDKVRAFQRYARYTGEYPARILERWLTNFLITNEIPTEEQAVEAEEKRRIEKKNACPTDGQKKFIWCIEKELGIKFNGTTKADAAHWIGTYKPQLDKKKAASDESKER